jgi:hypothetical protein
VPAVKRGSATGRPAGDASTTTLPAAAAAGICPVLSPSTPP